MASKSEACAIDGRNRRRASRVPFSQPIQQEEKPAEHNDIGAIVSPEKEFLEGLTALNSLSEIERYALSLGSFSYLSKASAMADRLLFQIDLTINYLLSGIVDFPFHEIDYTTSKLESIANELKQRYSPKTYSPEPIQVSSTEILEKKPSCYKAINGF